MIIDLFDNGQLYTDPLEVRGMHVLSMNENEIRVSLIFNAAVIEVGPLTELEFAVGLNHVTQASREIEHFLHGTDPDEEDTGGDVVDITKFRNLLGKDDNGE